MINTTVVIAAALTLLPFLWAAFFANRLSERKETLPTWVRLLRPRVLCFPYALVASSADMFLMRLILRCLQRWDWTCIFGGLSARGLRILPRSTKYCCSMRASMGFSFCGGWMV